MSTNETETPRQRLDRLRSEAARLREQPDAASAVPLIETGLPVAPGDEIHALKSGLHVHTGGGFTASAHTTRAGETICLTRAMIDASYDRNGRSWLAIIGDDSAQVERWGEIRFRLGRAPEGTPTWGASGDSDWREQRENARREAWAQPTAEARAAALAEVHRRFGDGPVTSVTLSTAPDPSIKQAEEQRARLDAGGVRLAWSYVAVEPGVSERR